MDSLVLRDHPAPHMDGVLVVRCHSDEDISALLLRSESIAVTTEADRDHPERHHDNRGIMY